MEFDDVQELELKPGETLQLAVVFVLHSNNGGSLTKEAYLKAKAAFVDVLKKYL